jgi:hypothetical protein
MTGMCFESIEEQDIDGQTKAAGAKRTKELGQIIYSGSRRSVATSAAKTAERLLHVMGNQYRR